MARRQIEPVGSLEIAKRLGVKPDTVIQWRLRERRGEGRHSISPMPEPRWTVSGCPAWDWAEVEAWARSTKRLSAA